MRFPHESRRSTPEPERPQRVRFSSVPPSAPLFTFSVLEWTPVSGLLAHLYPKRATSLQRLENNASMTSTEEERRDPRDRVVFETNAGTWTCFRQISCCGDVLVLEDAESIDVGPPRRHEFTWQQGPGRLPSAGTANTSFGANGGWRQTLASVSQSVTEIDADTAKHGTMISRPSSAHHRREIALQDIHSIRRHCFKRPVPLTFNSSGRLADAGSPEESRGTRSKGSHHGSSAGDELENLEWRYELWGPVGVVFMLRGGQRLFLVFASGQHAEQMEELLIDFASGKGLSRRQPQPSPLFRPAGVGVGSPTAMTTLDPPLPPSLPATAAASTGVGSPVSPGLPGSPAVSYGSLRLGSCEASFQGVPGSPSPAPISLLALPEAMTMHGGTSVASAAAPSLTPSQQQLRIRPSPPAATTNASMSLALNSGSGLAAAAGSGVAAASASSTGLLSTPSASSRLVASTALKPPDGGYLYCRPWGESERHRRYYLKPVAGPPSCSLLRLSRHKLPAWQKIRQTLGQEPRCVAVDVRQTFVTPSSTHENVFRVESVVDTYAQYKDVVPLGGAVATEGPANEAPSTMAARRRAMELCRHRPIIFEALAKSGEERAEWLAWLQGRGATILRPEATNAPHMVASPAASSRSPAKPSKESFKPLGQQLIPSSPTGNTSAPALSRANSVDRWVKNCNLPSSSTDLSPTVDTLGHGRSAPQLPLKESDSERGSTAASLRAKWPSSSPARYPQPHPHPLKTSTTSSTNASPQSPSASFSPDPTARASLPRRHAESSSEREVHAQPPSDDFDENGIVVEDDERDARVQLEKVTEGKTSPQVDDVADNVAAAAAALQELTSPSSGPQDEPGFLAHTVRPSSGRARASSSSAPRQQEGFLHAITSPTEDKADRVDAAHLHGVDSASSSPRLSALKLSNEEAATTEHTLTGTGPTLVGVARTPMYMEDTSSSDDDGAGNPRFPSPTLSNTVAATSPHSHTPSLRSPSVLQQNGNGDAQDGGEAKKPFSASYRSTPVSPRSTLTSNAERRDEERTNSYESSLKRSSRGTTKVKLIDTPFHAESVGDVNLSVSEPSVLRRSATDPVFSHTRRDTVVYTSELRNGQATPSRSSKVQATPISSSVKEPRAATATSVNARSATVAPAAAGEDRRGSHGSTPRVRLSSREASSNAEEESPSPDAPDGDTPPHALRAKPTNGSGIDASPVGKSLFGLPWRDEEGGAALKQGPPQPSQQKEELVSSTLALSSHDANSSGGSPQHALTATATAAPQDGSSQKGITTTFSASTSYPGTPERKFDARLAQFFTPVQRTSSDVDRRGERVLSSPFGPRIVPVPSSAFKLASHSGSYMGDSFARTSAARRSGAGSPLLPPPMLPPRIGSLTSSSRLDTPIDSGLRLRLLHAQTLDRNGSDAGGSPMLNSASSRATYRDSMHLSTPPLSFSNRDVMEQHKRAFRDSLFINHEQ